MSSSEEKRVRDVSITKDEANWEVEVKGEIPVEELTSARAKALKETRKSASIAGFRPGHAPESEVLRVYGEGAIMRRAAEIAIREALPEIFAREKSPIVEAPRVTSGSPEIGKPLSFTARAALAPEIALPDYKKVAAGIEKAPAEITISDEEHAQAMVHLRRERARIETIESGKTPHDAAENVKGMKEGELPALDDEFAKQIGYENIDAFHTTVRANMKNEKTRVEMEKRRSAILDALLEGSKIRYPAMLREHELDEMEARLADDLSRMGGSLETYLSEIKKTREELRKDWKEAADKRARIRLLLAEIARRESIVPDTDTLEREIAAAKKRYPQAQEEVVRAHLSHALRNEATLQYLENC